MVQSTRAYFRSFLNWLEMTNLFLFYITAVLLLTAEALTPASIAVDDLAFIGLRRSFWLRTEANDINAFNLFLIWVPHTSSTFCLSIFNHLYIVRQYHPVPCVTRTAEGVQVYRFYSAVPHSSGYPLKCVCQASLFHLCHAGCLVWLEFGVHACVRTKPFVYVHLRNLVLFRFGTHLFGYRNLSSTAIQLIAFSQGDFNFEAMRREKPFLAPIMIVCFIVVVLFVVLNMFIAILESGYQASKEKIHEEVYNNEMHVGDAMWILIQEYLQRVPVLKHHFQDTESDMLASDVDSDGDSDNPEDQSLLQIKTSASIPVIPSPDVPHGQPMFEIVRDESCFTIYFPFAAQLCEVEVPRLVSKHNELTGLDFILLCRMSLGYSVTGPKCPLIKVHQVVPLDAFDTVDIEMLKSQVQSGSLVTGASADGRFIIQIPMLAIPR
jgi:hypothetical protein